MTFNRILFQPGLSLPEFLCRFGTEAHRAAELKAARSPGGFRGPRDGTDTHDVAGHGARRQFQCIGCRHQTSLTAGSLFEDTKLPLTTWFLAIDLISQAQTGLSDLAMKRQLGVRYPTAWLLHHKMTRAMAAPICCLRLSIQPPVRLARRGVAPDRRRPSVRSHQGTGGQAAC